MMKKASVINVFSFVFISLLFINSAIGQSKKIELQNSNLEGVNAEGDFYWWKNQAIEGAEASYSIENFDVNKGSKKALKADIQTLGNNPWFVSTQFNQKFKGKEGDEITITFYAKKGENGKGKLKLVFQSDVKGSFQGKDFYITEDWQDYTHEFIIKEKSNNNQVKFWYLEAGTTYYIDDLSIEKTTK
jgi:hypothetical protein